MTSHEPQVDGARSSSGAPRPDAPAPFARRLLRHRGFLGFVAQDALSATATSVAGVVVTWYVFVSTGSAVDVGIVALAESLAAVGASLPAGTWVDRYDRRHLLIAAHAVRAAAFLLLAAFALRLGFVLTPLVAVVMAWTAASELRRSTSYAYLPDVVDPGELADANGIDRAATSTVQAVSGAIGGGIIATVGVVFGFAYAALAYGVAALATVLLLVRRPLPLGAGPSDRAPKEGMLSSIRHGLRWLISQSGLWQLSLSAMVFNFLFAATFTYLVVYVVQGLAAGPEIFGILLGTYAAGYVVGSMAMGRTRALRYTGRIWVLGYGGLGGLFLVLMGAFPSLLVALVASTAIGVAIGFSGNAWLTASQNLVPAPLRGRYFAIDGVLSFISGPPAIAVGALLVTAVGAVPTFAIAGIVMLGSTLGFAVLKPLWTLDGRPRSAP